MKLAIAAFTGRGAELANRLAEALADAGSPPPEVAVFGRAGDPGRSPRDWTERASVSYTHLTLPTILLV